MVRKMKGNRSTWQKQWYPRLFYHVLLNCTHFKIDWFCLHRKRYFLFCSPVKMSWKMPCDKLPVYVTLVMDMWLRCYILPRSGNISHNKWKIIPYFFQKRKSIQSCSNFSTSPRTLTVRRINVCITRAHWITSSYLFAISYRLIEYT